MAGAGFVAAADGLVHKRTSLILSLKSLHTRMTGQDVGTGPIKAMEPGTRRNCSSIRRTN